MRAAVFAIACATLCFASVGAAQQPRVIHGRLDPKAAGSDLNATFTRPHGGVQGPRVGRLHSAHRDER
jgi:hypothetical protein